MAAVDKKKKKFEKVDEKKTTALAEFEKDVQVKTPVNFFMEPFYSNCFVCRRGFKILSDKLATCEHTFSISPRSTHVGMCYMSDGGFQLDETKMAEVEAKYNVKVNPPKLPPFIIAQQEAEKLAAAQRKAAEEAAAAVSQPKSG